MSDKLAGAGEVRQWLVDAANLRFYAKLFAHYHWEPPQIGWGVFVQTLNEIADRIIAAEDSASAGPREVPQGTAPQMVTCDEVSRPHSENVCKGTQGHKNPKPVRNEEEWIRKQAELEDGCDVSVGSRPAVPVGEPAKVSECRMREALQEACLLLGHFGKLPTIASYLEKIRLLLSEGSTGNGE